MASETEVERLVTRLVLKDDGYSAGMETLIKILDRVARADRDSGDQEKKHQEQYRKSSQSLRTLTQGVQGLASALGSLNAPAREAVGLLGMLGGVSAPIAVVGIAAMASLAAIEFKQDIIRERGRLTEARRQRTLEERFGRDITQARRYPLLEPMATAGMLPMEEQRKRHEHQFQQVDQEFRRLYQRAAQQFESERGGARESAARLSGPGADIKAFIPGMSSDVKTEIDRLNQRTGAAEKWRSEANKMVESLKELSRADEEFINSLETGRWRNAFNEIRTISTQADTLLMDKMQASRYRFIQQNELLNVPSSVRRLIMGVHDQQQTKMFAKETALEVQGLGFKKTAMERSEREMLDPLNIELRITNQLNEAQDQYFQQHAMAMPARLSSQIRMNAAQQENTRLVQEGRAVYEQFMLPIERAAMSQERLRQQFKAGGFGRGPAADFAYMRAQLSAYGQAHKDYMQMTSATPNQALTSHTGELTWAYYQYQRGATAIPAEMIQGAGEKPGQAPGMKDLPAVVESGAGANKESSKRQLEMTTRVAEGIEELIRQGHQSPRLAIADVANKGG